MERYATWAEIKKMTINDVDLLNITLTEWQNAEARAKKGGTP